MNGGLPNNNSYTNTPNPHQSHAYVLPFPKISSGGIYSYVPQKVVATFYPPYSYLLSPKSVKNTYPSSSNNTFSNFRSL